MVIRRSHETRIVVWPHYFDRRIGRNSGRRVPIRSAVEKPKLERIMAAADSAGIKYEIDKNASHPFFWWEKSGRLLIVTEEPKSQIVQRIGQNIKSVKKEEPEE